MNPPNTTYGGIQVRICPRCGTLNRESWTICRECDTPLAGVEPVPADTLPTEMRDAGARQTVQATDARGNRVVLAGVDIPFWNMVVLLVKLSLAAIPAAVILFLIGAALTVVFGGFLAALGLAVR